MAEVPRVDALLVVSFGGPEGPDDVLPFLENVTRGRDVPRARLAEVAGRYRQLGGVSPINGVVRRLAAGLERLLAAQGPALPVYWGNRNWHPLLPETVRRMTGDGIRRALAFVTSAYSSYSGCRQYLEDIERARAAAGAGAPLIEKLRPYWNHPGFIEPTRANARAALGRFAVAPRVLFTAHSLPATMAASCDYAAQLADAARLVLEGLDAGLDWELVFQSRSGPPSQAWLEPDVSDRLRALAAAGVRRVLLVPIGFVVDHLEVDFDLDVQAAATARALGIQLERAATPGTAPEFVAMIRDLALERIEGRPPAALGPLGPRPTPCPPDCCRYDPARPAPS